MRSLLVVCLLATVANADAKLPSDAAFDGKPGDWAHYDVERSTGDGMFQTKAVAIFVSSLQGIHWFAGDDTYEQRWDLQNLHAMLRELAKSKGTKSAVTTCAVGKCTKLTYTGELTSFNVTSKLVITATLAAQVMGSGIAELDVQIDGKPVWRMKAIGYGNGTKAKWGPVPWKTAFTTSDVPGAYVGPQDLGQAFVDLRPENGPLVALTATGNLDKAIIRRYLKRNMMKLTYCYEKQLLAEPKLGAGSVDFTFEIAGDGKVTSSSARGVHREVENCAAGVVKNIEFPKPKDSNRVAVTFTIHYKPPQPQGKKI